MHFAHEAMEVRAALFLDRQAVEEQIDQEGLAAADAAPQVQAARGFDFLAEQRIQPSARNRLHQQRMQAIEFAQRGVLRAVVVPVAARDALRVALRGE